MNIYTLEIKANEINFRPQNKLEEIFQNVNTIIGTISGTVPLSRKFGTLETYIDDPTPISKIKFIPEIKEKVERYEPRVQVLEVRYGPESLDGLVQPIVIIGINEGVVL